MSDDDTCPHCGHLWDNHDGLLTGSNRCDVCDCMWTEPKPPAPPSPRIPEVEYFYEGSISADDLYEAFWSAAEATRNDETIHGMDQPYFDQKMDMVDCSGCGMPPKFWAHMARALASGD